MGAPSAAQVQALSDKVAALVRTDLAGIDSELVSSSNLALWPQVDASADAAVVAALATYADAVDRQSLPERYAAAIQVIKARPAFIAFAKAISDLVTSADGGSYASLPAYLTAVGATVHPLAAEVFRAVLGESVFTVAGNVTTVFPPNYQTKAADRVYGGADGSLTDLTTAAANATTADLTLFAANGNSLYVGFRSPTNALAVALSTLANVTIAPTFQYWNGNAYVAMAGLTDNSAGLTRNDLITWALPPAGQWVRTHKDAGGNAFADKTPLYYLRITRTAATVGTPPVGSCIRVAQSPVLVAGTLANHLGVDQPPLALIRITAANTIQVIPVGAIDFSRFLEPGLSMRALTPIGATVTLTLNYVDQDGANQSQVQSGFASPAALATQALTLVGSGARSVNVTGTSATTGGATAGVLEIYAAEARTPAL
jgi:hypothetical protein